MNTTSTTVIFKAPERFDTVGVQGLRPELDRLIAGQADVVIDLARTEALDGAGVGAMVYAFKRLAAKGNKLTVRNVSGQPLNMMHAAGLLRTLVDDRADRSVRARWQQFARRRGFAVPPPGVGTQDSASQAAHDSRTKGAA